VNELLDFTNGEIDGAVVARATLEPPKKGIEQNARR
jgi:hypothetical protein